MGYSSHRNNVLLFLNALEQILIKEGFKLKSGAAVEAASKYW
jgi:aspartate aminotransferase-like enzyme